MDTRGTDDTDTAADRARLVAHAWIGSRPERARPRRMRDIGRPLDAAPAHGTGGPVTCVVPEHLVRAWLDPNPASGRCHAGTALRATDTQDVQVTATSSSGTLMQQRALSHSPGSRGRLDVGCADGSDRADHVRIHRGSARGDRGSAPRARPDRSVPR